MKFFEKVYEVVKEIPKGKVMTYKQIGEKINSRAYRAIGQALRNNPDPKNIPCHRVIKSNGEVGGYFGKSDGKNVEAKIKLLRSEGIKIINGKLSDESV